MWLFIVFCVVIYSIRWGLAACTAQVLTIPQTISLVSTPDRCMVMCLLYHHQRVWVSHHLCPPPTYISVRFPYNIMTPCSPHCSSLPITHHSLLHIRAIFSVVYNFYLRVLIWFMVILTINLTKDYIYKITGNWKIINGNSSLNNWVEFISHCWIFLIDLSNSGWHCIFILVLPGYPSVSSYSPSSIPTGPTTPTTNALVPYQPPQNSYYSNNSFISAAQTSLEPLASLRKSAVSINLTLRLIESWTLSEISNYLMI